MTLDSNIVGDGVVDGLLFTSQGEPRQCIGMLVYEGGTGRVLQAFGVDGQEIDLIPQPHEQFRQKGAILFKAHNDPLNWDAIAMEQAKP